MTRAHLRIRGQVQGVSFRFYARQRAAMYGVAGWIRNCADGTVEAVVEGQDDAVREFLAWARRGPSMADVQDVEVRYGQPEGLDGFEIRR